MYELKIQYLFLIVFSIITLAAYVIIFGSAGLLVQDKLQDRLLQLEDDLGSLEKENEILSDRYVQLIESSNQKTVIEKKDESVIIIKFKDITRDNRSDVTDTQKKSEDINILEARLLYLCAMFFMGLSGYIIIRKYSAKNSYVFGKSL